MKVEKLKWNNCGEYNMPEDFGIEEEVNILYKENKKLAVMLSKRELYNNKYYWRDAGDKKVIAWMLK